jgi:hypothetical protein
MWVQNQDPGSFNRTQRETQMDISNRLEIIQNHHQRLLERYHCLGKTIAQLTAAGCIDAKEYWKDGKYLYLLYSMRNGTRKKKYVGNHPLRIKEARQKLENYKHRLSIIGTQENVKAELDEIELLIHRILGICSVTDMSSKFAFDELQHGYKNCGSGTTSCTQFN